MHPDLRDAYLARIGLDTRVEVSPADLRRLQVAHLRTVPFENLDIHLDRSIGLSEGQAIDKIVGGRGGLCYELNAAFAGLLRALGYTVDLLEARAFGASGIGIRFDHLCLRVHLDAPWLVDVGFGACFAWPKRLDVSVDQVDPNGIYRIADADVPGWCDLADSNAPQYRFAPKPRSLVDFAPGCRHHQTSPTSAFTRNPVCSLATPSGRVTLRGRRLVDTHDGVRTEVDVEADDLLDVYRDRFGVVLPRAPDPGPRGR